MTKYKRVQL